MILRGMVKEQETGTLAAVGCDWPRCCRFGVIGDRFSQVFLLSSPGEKVQSSQMSRYEVIFDTRKNDRLGFS